LSEQSADGRVAVVTGAAAGIGQALAGRLAADGLRIAIADLAPAEETVAAVEAAGSEGFAERCDISDGTDVDKFAAAVRERFGRCDVLVANAGVYPIAKFEDWTWEQWRAVMSVNVDSLFHLTKAFLPPMREAGWGRIVLAASNGVYSGLPGLTPYVASKGAVVGFLRSLAGEIGADGVTIINDAYNASPDSMAAALKTLVQIAPGRTIAVRWSDSSRTSTIALITQIANSTPLMIV